MVIYVNLDPCHLQFIKKEPQTEIIVYPKLLLKYGMEVNYLKKKIFIV